MAEKKQPTLKEIKASLKAAGFTNTDIRNLDYASLRKLAGL
jgi:hypothetical protein